MPQIVDEAGNEARADKGVELRSPETCLVQGSRTNAKFRVPVRWHNSFGPIVWLFDSFFLPINEGVDGCHFEGAPRHVCASRPCAELRGSRARASPELKSDLDDDLFSFVPSHSTTKVRNSFEPKCVEVAESGTVLSTIRIARKDGRSRAENRGVPFEGTFEGGTDTVRDSRLDIITQ